jgi:hypothetical protein
MKNVSIVIMCLILGFGMMPIMGQSNNTSEYKIDGAIVEKKTFDAFLATLKEVPHTWFCGESTRGGMTGYDGVNAQGTVYICRFVSENGSSRLTITRKKKIGEEPLSPLE